MNQRAKIFKNDYKEDSLGRINDFMKDKNIHNIVDLGYAIIVYYSFLGENDE